MEFTHTMFEYDFGGVTPQYCLTLKAMTGEELYEAMIVSIDEVMSFTSGSPYRQKPSDKVVIYLSELFRRNMLGNFPQIYLTVIASGEGVPGAGMDQIHAIIKPWFVDQLKIVKMMKEKVTTLLKAPLLSKQINDLMDEILDKNGNKPSQFKDFLTPDHYRMVRMGCDVSVWSMDEQELLLACLKRM